MLNNTKIISFSIISFGILLLLLSCVCDGINIFSNPIIFLFSFVLMLSAFMVIFIGTSVFIYEKFRNNEL